ncbi:glycosyltransferase [Thiocapsa roseopersicina]|uniref:Glycosyltransferase involved in cell wall bisynthesis n=1 Tax=Thiocapsa roseopersicina TaxID=1058 RepID=A0A1H2Y3N2_THIRO|nr:glycosyltransferase [Thiocapsa roseopersicina]SDW99823.1 Glycosyltransferase involved in cell wall bisynthesis [Thiocapsa roseopersicina]
MNTATIAHEKSFRLLYSTKEEFPNPRVDLTELFSGGLVARGHVIDWHMRPVARCAGGLLTLSRHENLLLTRKLSDETFVGRVGNAFFDLWHDLRLLWLPSIRRYDFIQVRDKFFGGLLGLVGAKIARTPYYYWMSFPFAEASLFRARDNSLHLTSVKRFVLLINGVLSSLFLYRIILPHADHIFVQSDRMKADVASHGIDAAKMFVVPMCINWKRISSRLLLPPSDDWAQKSPLIVYVGTLVRARRMDFLIETFAFVHRQRPDAVLVVIGDAPPSDMAILHASADRLGVAPFVKFLGFLPMEESWRYVKVAQVCVSPIRPSPMLDPGSPTKVIEYLALGKAVVANEQPDQARVLKESGAGLVVPFEVEPFARAILDLLADPSRAADMAKKGPDYVRRMRSYETLVPELEAEYLRLLPGVKGKLSAKSSLFH